MDQTGMKPEQQLLWQKINSFDPDDPESSFTFTDRLARENGWSYEFAVRAVKEYKKFIFLLCISDLPLTPSDPVDQVWHLHLLYTFSYWIEFCENTLHKQVHHGPTKGGQQEEEKFNHWHEKTKEFYQQVFQQAPPADVWPSSEARLSANFRRIETGRFWLIKKPLYLFK